MTIRSSVLGAMLLTAALVDAKPLSFSDYVALVRSYQDGDFVRAVEELQSASERFLVFAVPRLRRTQPPSVLKSAVLLHTQAAIVKSNQGDGGLRKLHIELADSLAEALGRNEFTRAWRLSIGYYYQSLGEPALAKTALQRLLRDYPNDANAFLALGAVHESSAPIISQESGDLPSPPATEAQRRYEKRRAKDKLESEGELKKALYYYESALRHKPDLAEARLRLARIRQRLGNEDEALKSFESLTRTTSDQFVLAMAHLFAGRAYEKRLELASAAEHYRAASKSMPHWQVPYVALSHTLHVLGNGEASREAINRALSLDVNPHDPNAGHWRYKFKLYDFVVVLISLREQLPS